MINEYDAAIQCACKLSGERSQDVICGKPSKKARWLAYDAILKEFPLRDHIEIAECCGFEKGVEADQAFSKMREFRNASDWWRIEDVDLIRASIRNKWPCK